MFYIELITIGWAVVVIAHAQLSNGLFELSHPFIMAFTRYVTIILLVAIIARHL